MESTGARAWWVRRGFAVVVTALVVLHLVPPHGGPDPVVLGVFPWDLAWHLGWMIAAGAAVFAMTSVRLWPDDPPTRAPEDRSVPRGE